MKANMFGTIVRSIYTLVITEASYVSLFSTNCDFSAKIFCNLIVSSICSIEL